MLAIELRFAAGRFHATPWGRNVNEAVPEWPPSPYRLLRALYDTWQRKLPAVPSSRVQAVLEALAGQPPLFALPPARFSHIRTFQSENKPEETERQLIFDAFVALDPNWPLLVAWPDLALDQSAREDLTRLLAHLNYLGRSESWVHARLLPTAPGEVVWNCLPEQPETPGHGLERVPVACPVSPIEYGQALQQRATPRRGRKNPSPPLQWLDALAYSTGDLLASRRSAPPAMQSVAYLRPPERPTSRPAPRPVARPPVHAVLFALDSKLLPAVTETLFIAERFRQILMGTHKRIAGGPEHVSPHFSGKDAAGAPLRGQRHAYYVPLDRDQDGRLDHLAVLCRDPLDDREQVALDRMARIWHSERLPDIRCTPVAWGPPDIVCLPSRKWISATPFVTPRFYRRGRGDFAAWLVNELRRELAYLELPPPIRLEFLPHLAVGDRRPLRWQEFRRSRKGDLERLGYGFALEFDKEVSGPIAVGYGAHFGLGLFVPDPAR